MTEIEQQHPREEARLMVVDDQPAMRDALCSTLRFKGYEVVKAEGGETALSLLSSAPVEVVLADLQMPGMDGIELTARMKALDADLEVIMVTASQDLSSAVEAVRKGASDYLTKPYDIAQLLRTIERAIERRRLVRENRAYRLHLEDLVDQRTQALEEKQALLERSYEETLMALVSALDVRDHETKGHSMRVVAYAVRLAESLEVEPSEMTIIRWGAMLHDIGKIAVADEILRKPGPLTDEEWQLMKQHPETGYRMLQHISFLGDSLEVVRCHQERWDGSGYPRGLSGHRIPLGARLFAVVDTLDAMTSDRPYRRALSLPEAREEIRRCAGTQFDPRVVDAFLAVPVEDWLTLRSPGEEPRPRSLLRQD